MPSETVKKHLSVWQTKTTLYQKNTPLILEVLSPLWKGLSFRGRSRKKTALMKLAMRYSYSMGEEGCKAEMEKSFQAVAMIEFSIEHMTGKEAVELVRAKKQEE